MRVPLTIGGFLERAALVYGDRTAVVDEPETTVPSARSPTPSCICRARAMAVAFDNMGVGIGERVAIVSPNSGQYLASFFGVSGFGRVLVPINFRLSSEEIAYILEHSGASVLLTIPISIGHRRRVRQASHPPGRGPRRRVDVGIERSISRTVRLGTRRGRRLLDQLHVGDDSSPQGGRAHPPQLLAQRSDVRLACHRHRPRHLVAHPSDVPLQRLGHALRDHCHGWQACGPAQSRRRGDSVAHRVRRGHAPVWCTDGARADPRGGRKTVESSERNCLGATMYAWSWLEHPHRRGSSSGSRPSSGGSSCRSTG